MRASIVLDEKLVNEALELSQVETTAELINQALTEFVANRKRLDLRELRGSKPFYEGYDYKAMR